MRKTTIHSWPYVLISIAIVTVTIAPPASAKADKVTICHRPPGNSGNAQTIEVGEKAVSAHLAHGDTRGACAGATCGNDILEGEEQCEPGLFYQEDELECYQVLGPGWIGELDCTSSCRFDTASCSLCGNGIQEASEGCDDGNTEDGDSCPSTCTLEPPPP